MDILPRLQDARPQGFTENKFSLMGLGLNGSTVTGYVLMT
jgi:hypothetical protein